MFLKSQLIEEVNKYLSVMQTYVQMQNSNGFFDINKYCEDVVCGLLNLTFNTRLVNLNNETYNFPAVDLGDYQASISFQVTSTNEVDKIRYTVCKFIENGLYNSFSQLNIFILGNKKNYRADIDTKGKISFDIKKNVIDMNDLSNMIFALDNNRIETIFNYLRSSIMLNNESSSRDKELYGMFTATIREYIKFFNEHNFAICPTNENIVSELTKIINEWKLNDRTFNNLKLEQYKQRIILSLCEINAYLSSPLYFQDHPTDGYIMPIKDPERVKFKELNENAIRIRTVIIKSYQEMCNIFNTAI